MIERMKLGEIIPVYIRQSVASYRFRGKQKEPEVLTGYLRLRPNTRRYDE